MCSLFLVCLIAVHLWPQPISIPIFQYIFSNIRIIDSNFKHVQVAPHSLTHATPVLSSAPELHHKLTIDKTEWCKLACLPNKWVQRQCAVCVTEARRNVIFYHKTRQQIVQMTWRKCLVYIDSFYQVRHTISTVFAVNTITKFWHLVSKEHGL